MENRTLGIIVTLLAAAGGAAALLTYLENRKSRATRAEVLKLDKQIKELELANLKGRINV